MRRGLTLRLQFLVALATFLAIALPAVPAMGQTETTGTTRIGVDGPAEGSTVRNGATVLIGGWAVDTAGPGTGVDTVRIYLNGTMDGGGTLLGTATYGDARTDVATALGSTTYTNSGFNYAWTPAALNGGTHTLYIYAQSLTSGWVQKSVTVHVSTTAGGGPAAPAGAPAGAPAASATPAARQGTYWSGYPGPSGEGQMGPDFRANQMGYPYPPRNIGPGYPGPGYPGPGYPGYPGGYPGLPNPSINNGVCILGC